MARSTTLTLLLITLGVGWAVSRSVLPARQASVAATSRSQRPLDGGREADSPAAVETSALQAAVDRLDAAFAETWMNEGLEPATEADDLTILRRLSLALHATIPSLEEIRQFEAEPA